MVETVCKAHVLAHMLSASLPGVAVLERQLDAETGEGTDSLIAEFGAIPREFPDGVNWTLALN